ncbi:unnamed protein product, partial [Choristocarpus tenellus]
MDPPAPNLRNPSDPVGSLQNGVGSSSMVKSESVSSISFPAGPVAKSSAAALNHSSRVVPNILPTMGKGAGGLSGAAMFPIFPGMFTPAALAAAAAAASSAGSTSMTGGTFTESMSQKSRDTRKRKRMSKVGEDIQVEVGVTRNNSVGVEEKGDSGALHGSEGMEADGKGGLGKILWPAMGRLKLGVMTPEHQEAGITGHERKERRKIRNRMSAQQHRERQRRRVENLEQCLREKDIQITSLEKLVQELQAWNKHLEQQVQKLETEEFPSLEDVLLGLDDSSLSEPVSDAPEVVCKPSSLSPLELDVEGEVVTLEKATTPGIIDVEDSEEKAITTDHSNSSSEEDSNDLSPLTSIYSSPMESSRGVEGRGGGGVIATPPLSPVQHLKG